MGGYYKRIGIMGGTFDPIHTGHLVAAESAKHGAVLDEVWFMPVYVPPHKSHAPEASPEERMEMVRLAVEPVNYFRSCDYEMQKGGVSYSYDTVCELKRMYPDSKFSYIIGADMVEYLPKWHKINELARMITFIGLRRPGFSDDLSILPADLRQAVTIVPMPLLDISSTQIRQRIKRKDSVRFLVPESVYQHMKGMGLYEPD